MPDALGAAFAVPGLWLLATVGLVAGLVRGFSGFGTALIYLPLAGLVLSPVQAIATLVIFDIFGPVLIARRALQEAHLPDLGRLFAGTVIGLPLGLSILFAISPEMFRYAVSGVALAMLVALGSGLRYRGTLNPPLVYATGGLAGVTGGATGSPGPPVILLYLASPHRPAVIRANTLLYLWGYDMVLLVVLTGLGQLGWTPVLIGLVLTIPNAVGNFCGAALFNPAHEAVYRWVAYVIIATSAVIGLPVWTE